MGYYSNWDFHAAKIDGTRNQSATDEIVASVLSNHDEYPDLAYAIEETHTKSYDAPDELKKLSLSYPDLVLVLEREGEESPDLERIHAHRGKSVSTFPEIVWPTFPKF